MNKRQKKLNTVRKYYCPFCNAELSHAQFVKYGACKKCANPQIMTDYA